MEGGRWEGSCAEGGCAVAALPRIQSPSSLGLGREWRNHHATALTDSPKQPKALPGLELSWKAFTREGIRESGIGSWCRPATTINQGTEDCSAVFEACASVAWI